MPEDTNPPAEAGATGDTDPPADTGRAGGEPTLLAELHEERQKRQTLQAELEEVRKASQTDQERAIEEARAQARSETLEKANTRIVRTEIRRLASESFADVTDAVEALDPKQFAVDDDGNVDEKAIAKALDEVLKRKPHWAKAGAGVGPGSADGGARGSATKATDMNSLLRKAAGYS